VRPSNPVNAAIGRRLVKIHDITLSLSERLQGYPGDPPTLIRRVADAARGDPFTLSAVSLSSHAGTHVDAPYHLLPGGRTVDDLPLDSLIGDSVLVSLEGTVEIRAADLELASIPNGTRRLLIKTAKSLAPPSRAAAHLADDAARWIVARGIRLVGIDAPSVDSPQSQWLGVHRILLGAGVVILESLALDSVPPGRYMLVCLPLKLMGCDGAPARVVLIEGFGQNE